MKPEQRVVRVKFKSHSDIDSPEMYQLIHKFCDVVGEDFVYIEIEDPSGEITGFGEAGEDTE